MRFKEAHKSLADAVGEVREAADFCRYYAMRARHDLTQRFGSASATRCG